MQTPIVSRRINVGAFERGLSFASGLALVSYILRRRPRLSLPLSLDAGYLIYRGLTGHCVVYQRLGINRVEGVGERGIQVKRSVTVNRPRDELFRIWRNAENLPRFMKHLKSVKMDRADNGRSHWVATAPLGREIEWDAEIIEERENEYLAWSSLPGSVVESRGSVHFVDAPGGRGTILYVSMEYQPPAGSAGAAFARLFGQEPGQQIREDLRRFKQTMETGETPTVEGQSSGRNRKFEKSIPERERERELEDVVEVTSESSFPASDPPGWVSSKRKKANERSAA
ncbi:MAG TPA: SRPBCC family protein [Anaerolineales bacterium]|nr:SRPBCC family protein [Anaerolineales bacterium]